MKKFYLGALGCLLAMGVSAQTLSFKGSSEGSLWGAIGEEFTSSGTSVVYKAERIDGIINVNLLTDDFEIARSLNIDLGTDDQIALPIIDLNRSSLGDLYSECVMITQTLFNEDEKFEFIRHIHDAADAYKTISFQIVSEDNEVLTTINSPVDSYRSIPYILKWGENYYFAIQSRFRGEYNEEWGGYNYNYSWDIYLIEKETNSVRRVNAAPLMSVMPALAERNSTVNVTLDAETVKNGGELIITDSNGRTVGRSHVEAGQTSVPVATDRMGSGVYNITLIEKGQKVENARIIVK